MGVLPRLCLWRGERERERARTLAASRADEARTPRPPASPRFTNTEMGERPCQKIYNKASASRALSASAQEHSIAFHASLHPDPPARGGIRLTVHTRLDLLWLPSLYLLPDGEWPSFPPVQNHPFRVYVGYDSHEDITWEVRRWLGRVEGAHARRSR